MISRVRTETSNPIFEMFERLVLQHLEKFALSAALLCLILIGILH